MVDVMEIIQTCLTPSRMSFLSYEMQDWFLTVVNSQCWSGTEEGRRFARELISALPFHLRMNIGREYMVSDWLPEADGARVLR